MDDMWRGEVTDTCKQIKNPAGLVPQGVGGVVCFDRFSRGNLAP